MLRGGGASAPLAPPLVAPLGHDTVAPVRAPMPPDLHHWDKSMKFCRPPPKFLAGYATEWEAGYRFAL